MAHTIKYYSMSKGEWDNGSAYVCAKCGRNHRHVTEIDGLRYGKTCGINMMLSMGIIESEVVVSKDLRGYADITLADIEAIVYPYKRAVVRQEWEAYHTSQLTVFTPERAISNAKVRTGAEIEAIIERTAGAVNADWRIIRTLKGA